MIPTYSLQASIVGATPERSSTALVVLSFPYSTDPPMFQTDGLAYTLFDAAEGGFQSIKLLKVVH